MMRSALYVMVCSERMKKFLESNVSCFFNYLILVILTYLPKYGKIFGFINNYMEVTSTSSKWFVVCGEWNQIIQQENSENSMKDIWIFEQRTMYESKMISLTLDKSWKWNRNLQVNEIQLFKIENKIIHIQCKYWIR